MEIKGDNFIKNVQIRQEKDEIQQRLDEIEKALPNNQTTPTFQKELDNNEIEENELGDIMLDNSEPSSTRDNKKKYIVLGLVLIILFLITIIVIRLLTNDKSTDDSFVQNEKISQEDILNNDNIEEQYQKIINEKLQNIKEKKSTLNDSINIEKTQADEIKLEKVLNPIEEKKIKEIKEDILEIKNEKIVKIPLIKKVVKKTSTTTSLFEIVKGSYVQVGSFTKQPAAKYLDNILNNGYNYKLYKVIVKGKSFTKVLVGPYKSKKDARAELNAIKKALNVPSAWIIKI